MKKINKIKVNTKLAKNFLFHSICQGLDIGYRKGKDMEEQGELFSFSFMPMGGR